MICTSEVEVRFIAETTQRTRVELEHRNIDRHGPGWEAVGEGVGGDAGWPLYLYRYAALFAEGPLNGGGHHCEYRREPARDRRVRLRD